MIYGIGTDIVGVHRIEAMLQQYGEKLMDKILSDDEKKDCTASTESARFMAKRFAAKEALGKAMGTGLRSPVLMPAMTVKHDEMGKPFFRFSDELAKTLTELKLVAHLSLSDEKDVAVAFVVLEKSMTIATIATIGPLMIDIAGTAITPEERERLIHPLVGGVILFTRNYESKKQLTALCAQIHALRSPRLLIAVDHEGGRVQRFKPEFTSLPAMSFIGKIWDRDSNMATDLARLTGNIMASELLATGVDFSFAPVLDIDYGHSQVIGDRAFHADAQVVITLAREVIAGMRDVGMACCGKHFPGHGFVAADSHLAVPIDERSFDELTADIRPYRELQLDAIMPAHIIYPAVDDKPAGFSPKWISMLRNELQFNGAIFSDDLSMEGASVAGNIVDRANAAWNAGCDMLPVCNAPEKVCELLSSWHPVLNSYYNTRINKLFPIIK